MTREHAGTAGAVGVEPAKNELDIVHTTARAEVRRRVPWMFLALAAGAVMVLVGGQFEDTIAKNLKLALFVPVIVYLSDCIGTETLTLVVRELGRRKVTLRKLLLRESAVGLALGVAAGVPIALFSYVWLGDVGVAMTLLVAMTANGLVAVCTGMLIPVVFSKLDRDPALGTDEITTALSDNISLLIYLVVASLLVFSR